MSHVEGHIVSLQLCPGHRKAMHIVATARAVENLGLEGDRHAIRDSSRQVLLIEEETLGALALRPGDVKENITTSGIALMSLQTGQRINVGSQVVLQITKPCSPCSRMDEIRPGLRSALAGRRGMLAAVVRGGPVAVGDSITVTSK